MSFWIIQRYGNSFRRCIASLQELAGVEKRQSGSLHQLTKCIETVLHQQVFSGQYIPADIHPESNIPVHQDPEPSQFFKRCALILSQRMVLCHGDIELFFHKPLAEQSTIIRVMMQDHQLKASVFQAGDQTLIACDLC